jgi:hypothetical protein
LIVTEVKPKNPLGLAHVILNERSEVPKGIIMKNLPIPQLNSTVLGDSSLPLVAHAKQ